MKHREFVEQLKKMTPEEREQIKTETLHASKSKGHKTAVTLSGMAITTAGKISKSNFLSFLNIDLDNYDDIVFTPEEARKVKGHLAKLRTGSTAMVPIYCGGEQCPFSARCPLHKMRKAPIGRQCPIENSLLKEYTLAYFTEFNIDPDNWTEVAYIQELAEIDIYLMRLNTSLSLPLNAELVNDQVIGVADDGSPIVQKRISPFLEVKDKLLARRSRIIKLMVGDRQEQYKKQAALKMKDTGSISSKLSEAREKLDTLLRNKDIEAVESETLTTADDFMKTLVVSEE